MIPIQLLSGQACTSITGDYPSPPQSNRSLLQISDTSSEMQNIVTLHSAMQEYYSLQHHRHRYLPRKNMGIVKKTGDRPSLVKILSEALALIEDDVGTSAEDMDSSAERN